MYRSIRRGIANHVGLIGIVAAIASVWSFLLSRNAPASMSSGVLAWWIGLCLVSAFNIWMWHRSAAALSRQSGDAFSAAFLSKRRQLVLSAVFVLGCAFRAILPRADVQRFGLFDSWVSCVMVGRTVATVAELCFAAQWALLLHDIARTTNGRFAMGVGWVLVPIIAIAEIFSWYAVLTTAYIGNAIEESLWTLAAMLVIVSFLTMSLRSHVGLRYLRAAGIGMRHKLCRFHVCRGHSHVCFALAGRRSGWTAVSFPWPGHRRCGVALDRHICVGPLEFGDSLDVPLFQRGGVDQPRFGARSAFCMA